MTDERRTKTIKFDMSDPDDKQLWEWLQRLPHGTFSEQVKAYWMEKMRRDNRDEQTSGDMEQDRR